MLAKPVYETLPLLYIAGGIAAVSTVSSFMAIVSGTLLAGSGFVILFLRCKNRTSHCKLVRPRRNPDVCRT